MKKEAYFIPIDRRCPKCRNKLMINVHTARVQCLIENCGYTEPCHLKGKIPSEKECSKCAYSPFNKTKIKVEKLKKEILSKKYLPFASNKILTLEELEMALEPTKLEFPLLKGKCSQAWNPQEIRSIFAKR